MVPRSPRRAIWETERTRGDRNGLPFFLALIRYLLYYTDMEKTLNEFKDFVSKALSQDNVGASGGIGAIAGILLVVIAYFNSKMVFEVLVLFLGCIAFMTLCYCFMVVCFGKGKPY